MKLLILSIGLSLMFLGGCQIEVVDVTNPENENVINSGSPLADMVQNTSMNDGSYDNIIDNSSCTAVVLPVSVVANGQELTIATSDDYLLIERIFDESATDVDVLVIVYPITVIMPDFTEVIVESQDDFDDLIEDCLENGNDLDIECIDFVYPVTISVYDSLNQVSEVFTVNSDEELFYVFASLDSSELASFTFPLTLLLSDSTEVIVNSNDELENLIEEVEGQCDEDDDNDYSDDDIDDGDLKHILLAGSWAIASYTDKGDTSVVFNGYVFSFFEEGLAKAMKGDIMVEGEWESYGDDGTLEIELDFGDVSPLDELDEGWEVIEFSDSLIRLTDDDVYLTFAKHSDNGDNPGDIRSLADIIIEGEWLVAHYSDSTIDETANYQGFVLSFTIEGYVTATNGTDSISGTWDDSYEDMKHMFELEMAEIVPFDKLSEEWEIVEYDEVRVELTHRKSSDAVEALVFEKR